ncbi:hypothetical protein OXPF_27300 [Oxobacter pfennigii]|uniref:Uncharacterized protein n=1 Tax=Oxobacter pfennigii TaxID=36849 RepID=A0A0P8Y936_9CLOT|nr:DUF6054 family protein [Oxobacter pfennigii]KPU43289.1 hypothetical protein OXPF_27300 [Oxobacter pfennigii]
MSKRIFKVSINPENALNKIKQDCDADLIHEEINDLGDGRFIGTLIFEKYFMRVSNRAALVVIAGNIKGETEVRAVATGSAQGIIFDFDWGAADDFVSDVEYILRDYLV